MRRDPSILRIFPFRTVTTYSAVRLIEGAGGVAWFATGEFWRRLRHTEASVREMGDRESVGSGDGQTARMGPLSFHTPLCVISSSSLSIPCGNALMIVFSSSASRYHMAHRRLTVVLDVPAGRSGVHVN